MALRSVWRFTKDEVVAERGVVTAKHPIAAEVGLEMLKAGGNAVDAAVAMGFAISVVEPFMSSLGGVGYMLIYLAQQGKTVAVDYGPRAPRAARADMYRVLDTPVTTIIALYNVEGEENIHGYRSVAVPGTTAGLCLAHRRFGSLPLPQVLEPAIHYAEQGFESSWYTTAMVASAMDTLSRYPEAARIFLPHGRPPRHWPQPEKVVQRDLGQTLRRIAREGADAFYTGEIAAAIAEEMRQHGGLLTRDDLAAYQAEIREPLGVTYRAYHVVGVPQANGCVTAMQTLSTLSYFNMMGPQHNSAEYLHLFVEAARHAFADRYRYLADPEYVAVPLHGILSPQYNARLAQSLDRHRATVEPLLTEEPWKAFAERALHDPWEFDPQDRPPQEYPVSVSGDGDCTTHFNVVDPERNVVCCTQTAVSIFGSGVACAGTGVLLNNGMVWFNPNPGHANSIEGYKRPLVNMTPLLVLRGGKPFLSLGAPGGRKIINANTQVLMNVIDHQMGMQHAIEAPRVDVSGRETLVDARVDESIVDELKGMGHNVLVVEESPGDINFATPLGVLIEPDTGRLHAGVDAFRIAEARGF